MNCTAEPQTPNAQLCAAIFIQSGQTVLNPLVPDAHYSEVGTN